MAELFSQNQINTQMTKEQRLALLKVGMITKEQYELSLKNDQIVANIVSPLKLDCCPICGSILEDGVKCVNCNWYHGYFLNPITPSLKESYIDDYWKYKSVLRENYHDLLARNNLITIYLDSVVSHKSTPQQLQSNYEDLLYLLSYYKDFKPTTQNEKDLRKYYILLSAQFKFLLGHFDTALIDYYAFLDDPEIKTLIGDISQGKKHVSDYLLQIIHNISIALYCVGYDECELLFQEYDGLRKSYLDKMTTDSRIAENCGRYSSAKNIMDRARKMCANSDNTIYLRGSDGGLDCSAYTVGIGSRLNEVLLDHSQSLSFWFGKEITLLHSQNIIQFTEIYPNPAVPPKVYSVVETPKNQIDKQRRNVLVFYKRRLKSINLKSPVQITPPQNSTRYIEFADFLVRSNVFRCNANHYIEQIQATIKVMKTDGTIVSVTASAGYCSICNCYFILEADFERIRQIGILLCQQITEELYRKNGDAILDGQELKPESLLHQSGYNVSAATGLTAKQRQEILRQVVENGLYSVSGICSHLDWLIARNKKVSNRDMSSAIEKWTDDRAYISNYKLSSYRTVGINSIKRKNNF